MAGKVVLITGASAGLGQAMAAHLAGRGHRVYGTSRRGRFETPDEAAGRRFALIPMDVRDDTSVREAVGFVRAREGRIDVLVNNAGVGLAGAVEETSPEEARALFETNLFGAHRVCRAVLPGLRAQGAGLLVNVSSIGGLLTVPFQGFYSASKYALEAMSDALRMELAPFGVRVCLVEPGDFRTAFTEHRVFCEAGGEGSPYAARCSRAVGVMERDERNGADPAAVARLVARLIDDPSPPPRRTAGKAPQRFAVLLKRGLPTRWIDALVGRVYRI